MSYWRRWQLKRQWLRDFRSGTPVVLPDRIDVIRPQPGDKIALHVSGSVSAEQAARLKYEAGEWFGREVDVAVLHSVDRVTVVREGTP